MTTYWNTSDIADLLTRRFVGNNTTSLDASSAKSPAAIDILITFDRHGVSSHPNHCSLYHGANRFISSLRERNDVDRPTVELYTLTTTSIFRKYTFLLDLPTTVWGMITASMDGGQQLLFVNSPAQVRTAQRAMTTAHRSQMRWFRWGWIGFSRYMVVNDLQLANPV